MNPKSGKIAVQIARETIDLWVKKRERLEPKEYPKEFLDKRGCFVTIHTYPERELRGCIGYPEPIIPLIKALVDCAIHSTQDPRFPKLTESELDRIIIEVSILTKPELITGEKQGCLKRIEIGKHGLIIQQGERKGLLLPQVAKEHGFDKEEFLMHTCLKAGLPPMAWKEKETKAYRFQSEIFSETKPRE